ncbi:wax ester/triacylglycerol synthase family O-acyltransferase [Nocardioides mesophilus]|uniref:Diacylglycerol O-acyltransferase n=1 Tax=Nocardioides mesophilus TaxID=433659 RepID=A0A7G9RHV4_9ACTN|nr:wax ester/triacylglycerol synthase family O-acyltransferase [Nocardioides mesophilus]
MGPVDTLWLNMDRPQNLMVVESLVLLAGRLDRDRFWAVLQKRMIDRYPVFAQVATPPRLPGGRPRWVSADGFRIEDHLHEARLPASRGEAGLQEYVGAHMGHPLRRDRPLWEVHLLEGLPRGTAVFMRFHHSLADGIALMQVLGSFTDAAADDDLAEDTAAAMAPAAAPDGFLGGAVQLLGRAVDVLPRALPRRVPAPPLGRTLGLALETGRVSAKLLLTRNPPTALSGPVGNVKRAAWSGPIPLPDMVTLAHGTGTTLNDVLVAALSGALRRYLLEHGDDPVDLPSMVPVNLRRSDQPLPAELGNRFALVIMVLPSSLPTAFGRLAETKRRMDQIKRSPEPLLTFGLIEGIGTTAPAAERVLVDFFANKAIGVVTNVPGPREQRYLAGARIEGLLGWAPESGNQTLGVCIVTYAGAIRVGFKSDAIWLPDPDTLVAHFVDELDELSNLQPGAAATTRRRTG